MTNFCIFLLSITAIAVLATICSTVCFIRFALDYDRRAKKVAEIAAELSRCE